MKFKIDFSYSELYIIHEALSELEQFYHEDVDNARGTEDSKEANEKHKFVVKLLKKVEDYI